MTETVRPGPRAFTGRIGDGDIRPLRVFCAVTRCGGFAAAESELQIGLPSISRTIKDLETRLGMRLCRRGRIGFALTDEGREVYESSLRLIADIDRFESDVRRIHSDLAGTLGVGVIDSLVTDKLFRFPEAIAAYKRRNPRVVINVATTTSNVIEQAVLDGSLQLGVVIGRRRVNQLDYRRLHREGTNLYCAESHPLFAAPTGSLSVEDIAGCDYVGYSFIDETDRSRFGVLLNKTASVDSMESVALLVGSGCFVGMLPDHYVRSHWRLERFRALLPEVFASRVDIELVTRRGALPPLAAAFADLLAAKPPAPAPRALAAAARVA